MNAKVLAKKLAKKTEQIIRGATCEHCGKEINYILRGHGGQMPLWYQATELEQVIVVNQNGAGYQGYMVHDCESKAVAEE